MYMIYVYFYGFMGSINVLKFCIVLLLLFVFFVQYGWRCKSCYIILQMDEDVFCYIKYVYFIYIVQYFCFLCGELFWY